MFICHRRMRFGAPFQEKLREAPPQITDDN
jgi:hypothetical protein